MGRRRRLIVCVRSRRAWAATALALGAFAAPDSAVAQWVEEPGQGWVDLTVYHQDTREAYDLDGEARPFSSEGHAVSSSAFLTVVGGVLPGVDAWLQVPYQRLRYDDVVDDRVRTGIGDTRAYLRVAPLRYLGSDFPFAIRGGVKVPVGDFEVDAEVIPLGDGQTDWEIIAEVGHSFYPFPAYASGWIGYRWREVKQETFKDFGDEAFFLLQAGANSGRWGVQLIAEGAQTTNQPAVAGITAPLLKRKFLTLTPSVNYTLGPGALTLGARVSVAGKNLPAGTAIVAGYFTRWVL